MMAAAVATGEAGEANSTSAVYKIAVEDGDDGDDALLVPSSPQIIIILPPLHLQQ